MVGATVVTLDSVGNVPVKLLLYLEVDWGAPVAAGIYTFAERGAREAWLYSLFFCDTKTCACFVNRYFYER